MRTERHMRIERAHGEGGESLDDCRGLCVHAGCTVKIRAQTSQ